MMKEYIARELRPHGRNLQEFAMIVGPNDETALLVSKYTTPKAMKPSEFVEERKQVYEDAKRVGDVTKVNHVRETNIAELPAMEEDVERSSGGRGRTFKVNRVFWATHPPRRELPEIRKPRFPASTAVLGPWEMAKPHSLRNVLYCEQRKSVLKILGGSWPSRVQYQAGRRDQTHSDRGRP